MRIISKYHDYYDCMQTPGVKEPLFLREELICHLDHNEKWRYPELKCWSIYGDGHTFGFAGHVHRILWLTFWKSSERKDRACWSYDESIDWYEQNESEKWLRTWRRRKWGPYASIKGFWNQTLDQKLIDETFRNAPIWIAEQKARLIHYNPRLDKLPGIKKLYPPPQAYQELAMYIGNLASPEKPIPKIDDETLAAAKGFDKFSFRKDPSNGRKRKGKS